MKAITWADYDRLLSALASVRLDEWKTLLPPVDSPCDPATEQACDEWARRLARDLEAPLQPPPHVSPWLVARMVGAAALAAALAQKPDAVPAPTLDRKAIEALLIDEWHAMGRQLWPRVRAGHFERS